MNCKSIKGIGHCYLLTKEDTGCDLAVSWLWMGRMPMWERDYGPIYMMPDLDVVSK